MIEGLIGGSHTSCVRLQDGQLVAWMLEVEPLCGGMLHVLEEHRRRGLAKAVACDLFGKLQHKWLRTQQQQQQPHTTAALADDGPGDGPGAGVYCYVVSSNTASCSLMQALGLSHTGVFTWFGFERLQGV
jgi:ribosomal protein S18 acetylase RimI-like enzyme